MVKAVSIVSPRVTLVEVVFPNVVAVTDAGPLGLQGAAAQWSVVHLEIPHLSTALGNTARDPDYLWVLNLSVYPVAASTLE